MTVTQETTNNGMKERRLTPLQKVADRTGELDIRTVRRLAKEAGALLKLGSGSHGRLVVDESIYWNALHEKYKVTE